MKRTNPYEQLYVKLQFERSGLFNLVKKLLPIMSVFYPCSSVHITPSFFFPRVYYLDKSDAAAAFFNDEAKVNKIIQARKEVENPHWQFIHADIESSLENIPEVDLVISLYGGDIFKYAEHKVKTKGYVLTSSEFSGDNLLKEDKRYKCLYNIGFQSGGYRVLKTQLEKKRTLKAFTKSDVFRDSLLYSIYQKLY